MSSMGVFRKLCLFNLFFYICPRSRSNFLELHVKKDGNEDGALSQYTCSPYFPSSRTGEQEDESFLDCEDGYLCKLPVVPLFWCNSEESDSDQFQCGICFKSTLSTSYYACLECEEKFHKECVESPLEIKHPSHPFHSLRLFYTHKRNRLFCNSCYTGVYDIGYHCSICDVSMHRVCAMKRIPFVVDHPKSHPHPLTFFPAQASLVCNICATLQTFVPTYICVQCVFAVHKTCMDFPYVIRISRHKHRISLTLSLPSRSFSCGICWKPIDNNYGAYSCTKCDTYFVHTNCAIYRNVWDKKELEEVPEEEDIIDDGEPFERIADGIILHPFHNHQLRLESNKVYDINKYCRGCALPTSEDQFYSCMECDFIIHESCANAPRMIRHPLHPDALTLTEPSKHGGFMACNACKRLTTGFFYGTEDTLVAIDLRCASITEPFEYQGHEHPLFLPPNGLWTQCQICKYEISYCKLVCRICDYTLCYRCAGLPNKVKYKHDSHLLTICDVKETSDEWCESCEGKIEVKETGNSEDMDWIDMSMASDYSENAYLSFNMFYKCNDCCTALHVHCLLGVDIFMRPGIIENDYLSITIYSEESESMQETLVRVLLNNSPSRPICTECESRCPFPTLFEGYNTVFCSRSCIYKRLLRI